MRIVVAEDEPTVREAIVLVLTLEGYEVEGAADGEAALALLDEVPADALVLDVLMPLVDGLEVCRRLRSRGSDVPILIVTAQDAVAQRVEGLDAGADDYLVKPFALDELLARLRALLRRTVATPSESLLKFGDVVLDLQTMEVRRGQRELQLTRTEFRLLELFMRSPRVVLTRSRIFEEVW